MKHNSINILNKICHDPIAQMIPITHLCHLTALIIEEVNKVEEQYDRDNELHKKNRCYDCQESDYRFIEEWKNEQTTI